MAVPAAPTNVALQTANTTNLITWNGVLGATSYFVQRSLDGVNYTNLATVTTAKYLDTAVTVGVEYWYQVAASNGSGISSYALPGPNLPFSLIPAPVSELSLASLRLASQQKADRVNANFVTTQEWNFFISLAMYELYDILIGSYENYYMATPAQFVFDGNNYIFPLPDGFLSFTNNITNQSYTAPPVYKLLGVDIGNGTPGNSLNNGWITLDRFNFQDRNDYYYPNSASALYGVFNPQYRLIGFNGQTNVDQIEFIPTPTANQPCRIWYIPKLPQLLQDTDVTVLGKSGWLLYVIVRAAKYALEKEEADTTKLDQEIMMLKGRIESMAQNRDAGRPDTITNVRKYGSWGYNGYGWNGPIGGI